jgi:D-alanyl-D-alanine endopeptidase (penicillin-binding protein 7)
MSATLRTALLLAALLFGSSAVLESALAVEQGRHVVRKSKVVVQKTRITPLASKTASPRRSARLAAGVEQLQEARQLALQSSAALVIEQGGSDAIFQKNADQVAPIASITKLMTAMVVLDSTPNLQETITITDEDIDYLRGSRSRLQVGSAMTRESALLLALMSSENRAANALARHYPGGMLAFIAAMNIKAQALGMRDSRFEDPTGLTSNNQSTANDLAKMVSAAYRYPLIRELTTTSEANVEINGRQLAYHNTNPLVKSPAWDVGLSKTGYIHEAGKCLVMLARVADRMVVIVLLDSAGKLTRVGDANRIKRWMERLHVSHKTPLRAALQQDTVS